MPPGPNTPEHVEGLMQKYGSSAPRSGSPSKEAVDPDIVASVTQSMMLKYNLDSPPPPSYSEVKAEAKAEGQQTPWSPLSPEKQSKYSEVSKDDVQRIAEKLAIAQDTDSRLRIDLQMQSSKPPRRASVTMASVEAAMTRLWTPPKDIRQRSPSPPIPARDDERGVERADEHSVPHSASPGKAAPHSVFELSPVRHSYLLEAVRKQGRARLLLWKSSGEMWGLYRWRIAVATQKTKGRQEMQRQTLKQLERQLQESLNMRQQQQVSYEEQLALLEKSTEHSVRLLIFSKLHGIYVQMRTSAKIYAFETWQVEVYLTRMKSELTEVVHRYNARAAKYRRESSLHSMSAIMRRWKSEFTCSLLDNWYKNRADAREHQFGILLQQRRKDGGSMRMLLQEVSSRSVLLGSIRPVFRSFVAQWDHVKHLKANGVRILRRIMGNWSSRHALRFVYNWKIQRDDAVAKTDASQAALNEEARVVATQNGQKRRNGLGVMVHVLTTLKLSRLRMAVIGWCRLMRLDQHEGICFSLSALGLKYQNLEEDNVRSQQTRSLQKMQHVLGRMTRKSVVNTLVNWRAWQIQAKMHAMARNDQIHLRLQKQQLRQDAGIRGFSRVVSRLKLGSTLQAVRRWNGHMRSAQSKEEFVALAEAKEEALKKLEARLTLENGQLRDALKAKGHQVTLVTANYATTLKRNQMALASIAKWFPRHHLTPLHLAVSRWERNKMDACHLQETNTLGRKIEEALTAAQAEMSNLKLEMSDELRVQDQERKSANRLLSLHSLQRLMARTVLKTFVNAVQQWRLNKMEGLVRLTSQTTMEERARLRNETRASHKRTGLGSIAHALRRMKMNGQREAVVQWAKKAMFGRAEHAALQFQLSKEAATQEAQIQAGEAAETRRLLKQQYMLETDRLRQALQENAEQLSDSRQRMLHEEGRLKKAECDLAEKHADMDKMVALNRKQWVQNFFHSVVHVKYTICELTVAHWRHMTLCGKQQRSATKREGALIQALQQSIVKIQTDHDAESKALQEVAAKMEEAHAVTLVEQAAARVAYDDQLKKQEHERKALHKQEVDEHSETILSLKRAIEAASFRHEKDLAASTSAFEEREAALHIEHKTQITAKEEQNIEHIAHREQLGQQLVTFENDLFKKAEALQELKADYDLHLTNIQNEKHTLSDEVSNLIAVVASRDIELSRTNELVEQHRAEIQELVTKIGELQALQIVKAEEWTHATEALKSQHELTLAEHAADSQKALEQSLQERNLAIEAKETEILNMNEKATLESHNFDMQLASAKAEHSHSVEMLETITKASEERMKAESEHALAAGKAEIEALRRQHEAQLHELKDSSEKALVSVRELSEANVNTLEMKLAGLDSIMKERDALQSQAATLTEDLHTFQAKSDVAGKTHESYKEEQSTLLQQLNNEKDALVATLREDKENQLTMMRSQLDQLSTHHEAQLAEKEAQIEIMTKKADAQTQQLRQDHDSVAQQLQALTASQLQQLDAERTSQIQQLKEELKARAADTKTDKDSLTGEINMCKNELRDKTEELRKMSINMQDSLASAERHYQYEYQCQREALKSEMTLQAERAARDTAEAKAASNAVETALAAKTSEVASLNTTVKDQLKVIGDTKTSLANHQNELKNTILRHEVEIQRHQERQQTQFQQLNEASVKDADETRQSIVKEQFRQARVANRTFIIRYLVDVTYLRHRHHRLRAVFSWKRKVQAASLDDVERSARLNQTLGGLQACRVLFSANNEQKRRYMFYRWVRVLAYAKLKSLQGLADAAAIEMQRVQTDLSHQKSFVSDGKIASQQNRAAAACRQLRACMKLFVSRARNFHERQAQNMLNRWKRGQFASAQATLQTELESVMEQRQGALKQLEMAATEKGEMALQQRTLDHASTTKLFKMATRCVFNTSFLRWRHSLQAATARWKEVTLWSCINQEIAQNRNQFEDDLEAQAGKYQDTVKDLEHINMSLQHELLSLQHELRQSENTIFSLQSQVTSLATENDRLTMTCAHLRQDAKSEHDAVKEMESKFLASHGEKNNADMRIHQLAVKSLQGMVHLPRIVKLQRAVDTMSRGWLESEHVVARSRGKILLDLGRQGQALEKAKLDLEEMLKERDSMLSEVVEKSQEELGAASEALEVTLLDKDKSIAAVQLSLMEREDRWASEKRTFVAQVDTQSKDIETLESEVEALRTMIESMEYSASILEAEFHRMQRDAATVVLRMAVTRLGARDCQGPFRVWHSQWRQDLHENERAMIEQHFISTEHLLSNSVATLQKEFQSRVAAVQKKADREITRVKEVAAEESELSRLNQMYASRRTTHDSDFLTDASDDEIAVSVNVAQTSTAASPTAAVAVIGDGPVDEQLAELKSMLDQLNNITFE